MSKVVVLTYGKEGDVGLKIKDIIEIKSSRGRTIRPTAKRLVVQKKK